MKTQGGIKHMNKQLITLVMVIMLVGLASAGLGTFKQNTCVEIRTLGNCSITLVEVTSPTVTYNLSSAMSLISGQTYNYTFCNTSEIGTYTYSWNGACLDCGEDNCGNSFEVTPSGFLGTLGFYIFAFILASAFVVLGFTIKDGWFVVVGGMSFLLMGIYSLVNGVADYKDTMLTWGLGLFQIFMGGYLAIRAGLEIAEETGQ